MKIYITRHSFIHNNIKHIFENIKNTDELCQCLSGNDHFKIISPESEKVSMNSFEIYPNGEQFGEELKPCQIFNKMEVEINYNYEEIPYEIYYEEPEYVPIKFCPYCGEKIELIIDEDIDITQTLLPILSEIDKLEKKRGNNYREQYALHNKLQKAVEESFN